MIKIKRMAWSNAFSYGDNNEIYFDQELVQLVGKNGHGKSSIALILEEVLYNKNSKNVKKGDILNRYSKAKSYYIELELEKDLDTYIIRTTRGSTQTVKLERNGVDISSHTSTGTYKLIEEILGMDHKTFTQIVYQSSASSLEFLTATDTNRKKFLIDLLNLSKYTDIAEVFKSLTKEANNEVESIDVKLNTINNWISNISSESLDKQSLVEVPSSPVELINELTVLENKLTNIASINKKIAQNNKYKEILSNIDLTPPVFENCDFEPTKLLADKLNTEAKISSIKKTIAGIGPIKDKCDSCGQPIDSSHKKVMIEEAKASLPFLENDLATFEVALKIINRNKATKAKYDSNVQEWERYHALIDQSVQSEQLDEAELVRQVSELKNKIAAINISIIKAERHNQAAVAHNTKVDVIKGQLDTMKKDLAVYTEKRVYAAETLSNLQILTKTFSTTGLVAYKIECLVKDLEELTNEYLAEMSDGRFQIFFKINSSDKLLVVITDNGQDIDILALSNGERARVNISTLLAIRKLMQGLSNTRINLLILDETVESLDAEGKEKLIEVLLKEESLNTMLVSHGFTHPLLAKINIIKENNISRIEV